MTDRNIAFASLIVAAFALLISTAAFIQSNAQYRADYEEEVTLKVSQWPITPISSTTPSEFRVEVRNTSKRNLEYRLRLTGNAVCVSEDPIAEVLKPCQYESRPVRISKPEAGSHTHTHTLYVSAMPGSVKISPLAYASDPDYFVSLEVISVNNGASLHEATCYYNYIPDSKSLVLYKPIIDTTGASKTWQARCM